MEKYSDSPIINLTKDKNIIVNPNIHEILKNISNDTTILYFNDDFSTEDKILELLGKEEIKKLVIMSKKNKKINNKKVIIFPKINSTTMKKMTQNIIIIVKLNDEYRYSKFIIKNLEKFFILSNKYNKKLGFNILKNKIIALVYSNKSIYTNDILNAFKVLILPSKEEKNEFIYDTVCEYLDNEFRKNNICDFKNDQCIANRAGRCTGHKTMGCCYSFDYAKLYELRLVKNVKLCQYMQNKSCSTKNISCKLFTCKCLKEKNIFFNTHEILLLDCFFNRKQHEIITSNFFRTREEILEKLLEKNYDTYLWYYMFKKYAIKN